jgi:hypothetical protein
MGLGTLVGAYDAVTITTGDGPGRELETKSEGFIGGLARPELHLSGHAGGGLWLGVTGRIAGATVSTDTMESSGFEWAFLPHLEYAFSPGSGVRPYMRFVIGGAGFEAGETSAVGFTIGGDLGLHLFAADNISITPSFQIDFTTGSASLVSGDAGYKELVAGGALTLIAWFGGGDEEPADRPRRGWTSPGASAASYTIPTPTAAAPPSSPELQVASTPPDRREATILRDERTAIAVIGAPQTHRNQIALRVERLGVSPALGACREVNLLIDGEVVPTDFEDQSSRQTSAGIVETIIAVTTPESARRMADGEDVVVTVCDEGIRLPQPARSTLGQFMNDYASVAGPAPGAADQTSSEPVPEDEEPPPWAPPSETEP